MFEAKYLAALWIDAGHHVPDGAIFSGRIHRLKDQQDGMAVGCIEKLLLRAQLRDMFCQQLLILLLRFVHGIHDCWPFPEIDHASLSHAKIL